MLFYMSFFDHQLSVRVFDDTVGEQVSPRSARAKNLK